MKKMTDSSSPVHTHLDLPQKSRNGEVQLLIFSLSSPSDALPALQQPSLFSINIFKIREVIKQYKWIAPPKEDDRLLGLLSLRGEWIPILNTFRSLGLPPINLSTSHPLILIEYSRRFYGVLVESIAGIDSVLWKDIHTVSHAHEDTSLVTGVGVSKNFGEFMILDIDKCITNVFPDITDMEMKNFSLSLDAQQKSKYRGCQVFLADDSSVIRKHLIRCLEMLNVKVYAFSNGMLLFNKLLELKNEELKNHKKHCHPHSLIVTDIEMPEMDGISLVKKIKQDSFYAETRTIIYSSLSVVTSRQIGIDVGADDVIQKLNTATLMKTVMSHLEDIIRKNT